MKKLDTFLTFVFLINVIGSFFMSDLFGTLGWSCALLTQLRIKELF
jgi:hypothetical protein